MKTKVSNFVNRILAAVISLLGFSACDNGGMMLMYGTPTFDYQANGRVVDEEGEPIEGIRVKVTLGDEWAEKIDGTHVEGGVVYSGKDGSFETKKFEQIEIYSLTAIDVDGEENGGEFETQEVRIDTMRPTYSKGGTQKYENIEIVMTEKVTEEDKE
ncbi:MAG: radical SAM-associated putative lipoprotein [Alistipes sp.]|nr:radical SAM-associated putative lipoprotein [Alistipes sp.]